MNRHQWLASFERQIEPAIRQRVAATQRCFLIAGKRVNIYFSSLELGELLSKAIAHREYFGNGDSALDIHVLRRSDLPGGTFPSAVYGYAPERSWNFHGDASAIELYSPENRCAYFLVQDHSPLKYWTIASPFRRIFDWFLSTHGIELVHGAAVGSGECAVLITGPGGSGKSTTAMQSVAHGMTYLSDDHVALADDGTVYGLYRTLKVLGDNPFTIQDFGRELSGSGEKRVLVLDDTAEDRLPASALLNAVIVSRICIGAKTRLTGCTGNKEPDELSPFALKQTQWLSHIQSARLRQMVNRYPRFTLELGGDASVIPEILAQLCQTPSIAHAV